MAGSLTTRASSARVAGVPRAGALTYASMAGCWACASRATCAHDEKRKAEEQLAKLEEDGDLEGTEELAAARAEVAAATYCYR